MMDEIKIVKVDDGPYLVFIPIKSSFDEAFSSIINYDPDHLNDDTSKMIIRTFNRYPNISQTVTCNKRTL